ncbi:GDSL-type esterase/lipase family protein [Saccharibacillus sacchari]|uniref:GDSL-type esterase/lipase family protein n=1 Tax=Saccharibacillus sacchari TaxID=456493 RepID=A0ACC6PJL3_9BACL
MTGSWREVEDLPQQKRILFMGDSITENGTYIRDLEAVFLKYIPESQLEWIDLGVSSETAAGTQEAAHPFPRPCVHERLDRALAESKPDWVFLCYGMNDGVYRPLSANNFSAYRNGIGLAAQKIKNAGALPILMTPPPFDVFSINGRLLPDGMPDYSFEEPYERYDDVLERYADWLLQYGREQGVKTVDIRRPLLEWIVSKREADRKFRYGDGVHPQREGHAVIAHTILRRVFHIEWEKMPEWLYADSEFLRRVTARRELLNAAWREHVGHTNPYKLEALPLDEAQQQAERLLPGILAAAEREGGTLDEQVSEWEGFVRRDYVRNGRACLIIEPATAAPGRPWIWRTEFFGHFMNADLELVRQGWHIGYVRLSDLYGSPFSAEAMEEFRADAVSRFSLDPKPAVFGFSRGGLYAIRYAETYPQHVRALYLDAPVVDIASWPGGIGAGHGSPGEWRDCLDIYGIAAADALPVTRRMLELVHIPVEADIPLLLIAGGADEAVPFEENGDLLDRRYRELGGRIRRIIKPNGGHHPHGLDTPDAVVKFVRESFVSRI